MTDLLDMAKEQEENRLQGILAARKRPAPAYTVSATHCADCGTEIPAARRLAVPGCELCTYCQTLLEKRRG